MRLSWDSRQGASPRRPIAIESDAGFAADHPLIEQPVRLLGLIRSVLDPMLEEHLHCVADDRSGLDAEMGDHLGAVDGGTQRIDLLLLAELDDPILEFIDPALNCARTLGVAGRDIAADQFVQLLE